MIIRQNAFEKNSIMLKGNLHCHTTLSDGQCSPGTVIRQYARAGYDFLAITDHNRYNFKNYAPETDVLILPGAELGRLLGDFNIKGHQVVHAVALGYEETNGFKDGQEIVFENGGDAYACQEVFDVICDAGNISVFCHPEWSGNTIEELVALDGYSMIEVWNTGSALSFGVNYNAYHWDVLLDKGKKIYAVASDDGHSSYEHCQSFVMVNAEKTVSSILNALKKGAFYASTGPEIYDFYIEDDIAVVHCSPAVEIIFRSFRTPNRSTRGENLTGAQTRVRPGTAYIRAEVVDVNGRRAWTNPIFFDETT